MKTLFRHLILGSLCLGVYGLPDEAASPTGRLLLQFAEQLHSQTRAPVLVKKLPDESCRTAPLTPFVKTPQLVWNKRSSVTSLRYWGDHVCVDMYVESESGEIHLAPDRHQVAWGDLSKATKYTRQKQHAFQLTDSGDWEQLFISVPRSADLRAVESLASSTNNLHAAAKRFSKQAAALLREPVNDRSRTQQAVTEPAPLATNRLPGFVYVGSLVLVLLAGAAGLYWSKRNLHRYRLEAGAQGAPAPVPGDPAELFVESTGGPEEQIQALNSEVVATFRKANVSDEYLEVVTKSAAALFRTLEKNHDPAAIRKVRHYLAGKLADWHSDHIRQK